jgi:hypothetical protein
LAANLIGFESGGRRGKELAMPPLIVWGVGVLGGAALLRWAIKEVKRVNRELEEARLARMAENMQTERIPKLRRDPVTGTYRPE